MPDFQELLADLDDHTSPTEVTEIRTMIESGIAWQPNAIRCLRGTFAPLDSCPGDAPPAVVAQLECDEQCSQRRVQGPPKVEAEAEPIKPAPVVKVLKAAA